MSPMRTLLLQLPPTPPSPTTLYGVAELDLATGAGRVQASSAPLSLLPRAQRQTDIVVLLPAASLSWHRVTLPHGLGRSGAKAGAKLQAALHGLLEDQLLQDPQQVHLALAPQWSAGSPCWVAACDKTWLHAHLQTLQDAGLPVQRIVPEFAPSASGPSWHALGDEKDGWLWHCDAEQGVSGWPVAADMSLPHEWMAPHAVRAEPGLVRWAQARGFAPVALMDRAAHWSVAASGPWNLAQFDLQTDARTRRWQSVRRAFDAVARHPQWRPARWGFAALVIAQMLGLQTWAWLARQQWQAEQDQWTHILQQSFPKVSVVVDAPLQMAREVARLQQASGQLMPQDFESQLSALGNALPTGMTPVRLDYQDGQLRWPALTLSREQHAALTQTLRQQGYHFHTEGGIDRLQVLEGRP